MRTQPHARSLRDADAPAAGEGPSPAEGSAPLRMSSLEYRALFDRKIFCVYAHDLQGAFLDANDAALRLLGYGREDVTSLNLADLLAETCLPGAMRVLDEIVRTGAQSRPAVYRLRRKDGGYVWIETEAWLVRPDEGPCAVLGIALDITARKESEEALRRKEERYRRMFEDSPISLWEEDYTALWEHIEGLGLSGPAELRAYLSSRPEVLRRLASRVRIVRVNKATLKMYQADSLQDFIGGLERIFDQDAYEVFLKGVLALAAGETRFESEAVNTTLRGEKKQILIRWTVVPDEGGRAGTGNILVSVIDITGIKALEREKANLTAMFAHDVKSSLVAIQGLALRLLRKAGEIPDDKREAYIRIIRKESAKLDFLVDDFLEFSRLQTGRLHFDLGPLPLQRELDEIFELYQSLAEERGIRLEREYPADLPVIRADANRLRRVFQNLLDNAFKFSREAGASVTLSAREDDDSVWVRVADEGAGIDPEDLPFIFDPFHRGRGNGPGYRGHGVGLAAVKSIVEGHGGRIVVESEKGRGAAFTVSLPKPENGRQRGPA